MTSTMLKVLVHGAEIISYALIPIGQLSEEAVETNISVHIGKIQMNVRKTVVRNMKDRMTKFFFNKYIKF